MVLVQQTFRSGSEVMFSLSTADDIKMLTIGPSSLSRCRWPWDEQLRRTWCAGPLQWWCDLRMLSRKRKKAHRTKHLALNAPNEAVSLGGGPVIEKGLRHQYLGGSEATSSC